MSLTNHMSFKRAWITKLFVANLAHGFCCSVTRSNKLSMTMTAEHCPATSNKVAIYVITLKNCQSIRENFVDINYVLLHVIITGKDFITIGAGFLTFKFCQNCR